MKNFFLGAALAVALSLTIPAQVQQTRFDVNTPPTTDPVTLGISPDGDKIFFVADRDGKYELWVHTLSSGTARPLPGTGGLNLPSPCWSPDSRSIAFFGHQNFQRIDLETGAVRILVSFRSSTGSGGSGTGCTWNRDGTILFSMRTDRSILRISDQGGTPARVTPPDPLYYSSPYFLPDGQHFLFAAQGVYMGELSGAAPKRLPLTGPRPIYSPSGHLLSIRQGALYAQEFDPATQRLGDPFEVLEGVMTASVSARGDLVYRTPNGGALRQFKWFDRTGKDLGALGRPVPIGGSAPELSPDGQTVVFQDGRRNIVLLDVSTGNLTPLISDPANDTFPVWSPDGKTIYFSSNQTGQYEMYEKSAFGNEPAKLVTDSAALRLTRAVSPDRRFLLFRESGDIWAVQLDGNPRSVLPVVQSPTTDDAPQFAPNGRWIVYQEIDANGNSEIYLRQFPSGRRIRVSDGGGAHPRWRPDGKELFYIASDGRLMAVPIELSPNGQEAKIGMPVGLFRPPIVVDPALSSYMQQYVVSNDGQRFLVAAVQNLESPIHVIRNWKPVKSEDDEKELLNQLSKLSPGASGDNQQVISRNLRDRLAQLYVSQGKYEKAEEQFGAMLAIQRRIPGGSDLAVFRIIVNHIGWTRLQQEKYVEAEKDLREVMPFFDSAKPDTLPRYVWASNLGASLVGQKKYEEAEPRLLEGYDGMRRIEPIAGPRAANDPARFSSEEVGEWIVRLYQEWGKPDKAVEWRAKLQAAKPSAPSRSR